MRSPLTVRVGIDEWVLLAVVRLGALLACVLLAWLENAFGRLLPQLGGLLVLALVASVPLPTRPMRNFAPVAEAAVAAAVVITAQSPRSDLYPYLLAPTFAAGWLGGARSAVLAAGSLSGLILMSIAQESGQADRAEAAVWCLLSLFVGLLSAWTASLRRATLDTTPDASAYAEAYELLRQLSPIARRLPEGLDTAGLAEALLQQAMTELSATRGAVLSSSSVDSFDVAAEHAMPAGWLTVPRQSGLLEDLTSASHPAILPGGLLGEPGRRRIGFPLSVGNRRVGLLLVEVETAPTPEQLAPIQEKVVAATLRMDTARMFDEVRLFATAEERRRVAREIHDGIAQELASLGYEVDDVAAMSSGAQKRQLQDLRQRITALVGELRMNIFMLRSDVAPGMSLGTALSDYVRQVGAASNLTVHLTLLEEPVRLPREMEAELLRIAQEAVTNARRHAGARNLWVSCTINPPAAQVSVVDDGRGMGTPRPDSFGMEVMRERAERIGGVLEVVPREGGGTVVTATVNPDRLAQSPVRGSA